MSSKTELAREYAKLVLDAHSSGIEKYSNLLHKSETKKKDIILTELKKAVSVVLKKIDEVVYENTPEKIKENDKLDIYSIIDSEIGVSKGTFELLKKGSVQSAIAYENALLDLIQQIQYV